MKKYLIFAACIAFSMGLLAEKVASLPDLARPTALAVDGEQFYVCDGAAVYIYSQKDFRLKTKFGKAGEGPQEFVVGPGGTGLIVFPYDDYLVVNSIGKVSFYTREGKFIKELKARATAMPRFYQPLGEKFVGLDFVFGEDQSLVVTTNIFDAKLEKLKEIYRQKFMKRGSLEFPLVTPIFYVVDGKIFVGGEEGFAIKILDTEGNILTSIKREYKPLKVTEEYKKGVFAFFKTLGPENYEVLKNVIKFSEYFPVIQIFWVVDQKLYVHTYMKKDNKDEFFIYDLKGKFLKRLFLPIKYLSGFQASPYAINQGKLYQLVENEDEEMWELHVIPVE